MTTNKSGRISLPLALRSKYDIIILVLDIAAQSRGLLQSSPSVGKFRFRTLLFVSKRALHAVIFSHFVLCIFHKKFSQIFDLLFACDMILLYIYVQGFSEPILATIE